MSYPLNDGENMYFIVSVFTVKVNIKVVKLTLRMISHYNNALRSLGESMEYLKNFFRVAILP